MSNVSLTRLVQSLPSTVPFVGPEDQERARGRLFEARIGANENVFGPSPSVIEFMREAAPEMWMYGDPQIHDLRDALARYLDLPPECIMIGEGIDGLLGLTVRLFVEPGMRVVTSRGAYPTFNFHVTGFGGVLDMVDFHSDGEDTAALAKAAQQADTALVYFSNPNNPMGSWHPAASVERLIGEMPAGTVLCLDEAYIEFAPDGTAPAFDIDNPQVIRFRTFSKAYGLAGLRIGYAITHPDTVRAYDRVRNHFGVNRMAQEAACAAIGDQGHLGWVRREVATARQRLGAIAARHGLRALPSATNFVAIDCGRDGAFARAVMQGLLERDIFVRMPGVPPQDRCIRVSAGSLADLDMFDRALGDTLDTLGPPD